MLLEIVHEKMGQTFGQEKFTAFVRCKTKEKLQYINLFPLTSKKKRMFEVIPGIRRVFQNNCTYVTFIIEKEASRYFSLKAGICVAKAQKIRQKHIPSVVGNDRPDDMIIRGS